MRAFGRDLIRGGHYGQRSCEPRQQAEHMAAPTNAAKREKSSCQLGAVAAVQQPTPVCSRNRYMQHVARNFLEWPAGVICPTGCSATPVSSIPKSVWVVLLVSGAVL